jgi:hypothetical protein
MDLGVNQEGQASQPVLPGQEALQALENKDYLEVFQEAVGFVSQLIITQDKLLSGEDQVSRLGRSETEEKKKLAFAKETRSDFEKAKEAFQEKPGKVLVEEVSHDPFLFAYSKVFDQMVEELPPDSSQEDKDQIVALSRSVREKISVAHRRKKESIRLEGEEGSFYQRVLTQALVKVGEKIDSTQGELDSIRQQIEQAGEELEIKRQKVEQETESLVQIIEILDQKEKEAGAPSLQLEEEKTESQAEALISWRKEKLDKTLISLLGGSIGKKWAFFWQLSRDRFAILNKGHCFDDLYPEDLLIYRTPGTVYAIRSEALRMSEWIQIAGATENGIPKLLRLQEEEEIKKT